MKCLVKLGRKGISPAITAAIVAVVGIAVGIFIAAQLLGLSFAIGGSPAYTAQVNSLKVDAFEFMIKNLGSVAITDVNVKVLDAISNTEVVSFTIDLDKNSMTVNQGQEMVLRCATGFGTCKVTVSGYGKEIDTKVTWPSNKIIAGRPYKVISEIIFANGERKTWSTIVTATT